MLGLKLNHVSKSGPRDTDDLVNEEALVSDVMKKTLFARKIALSA